MRLLVVHAVAWILASPLAAAAQVAASSVGEGVPVQIEAGKAVYDSEQRRVFLSEGVVLRRGAVTLRARSASYDDKTGEVDATGDVLLSEPGRVMRSDSIHLVMDGPFESKNVVAFYKDKPLELGGAESLESVRVIGRNRLTVTGERVSGQGGETNQLSIDDARITMCDCRGERPSWEIRATHADVIPGKRAILTWPVLYVTPRFLFIDREVPIFVFPWLYLPLAERQTGLLMPVIASSPRSPFILAQPVFFDLGRSYDATLTPQYAFGLADSNLRKPLRGIEGPGAELELRWAPLEGTAGWFSMRYLHDRARSYQNVGGSLVSSPPHGDRLGFSLFHDQRISNSTRLHAEIGLATDPLFVSDYTQDLLLRASEYNRSTVALAHRLDDGLLEVDAAYHLSLAYLGQRDFPVDPGTGAPRFAYGALGSGVPVFHRLPAASATLLPVRLAGPLFLSGSVGVARFAPLRGTTGDEGTDGVGPGERSWPGPSEGDGQLDHHWDSGERLAATRALVQAELRAPFTLGRVLSVEPWLRGTAAGYQFATGRSAQFEAWGVASMSLSAELARTYGAEKSRVRHSVEPRVEWRGGTSSVGPGLPAYAYDELDAAPTAGLLAANNLPRRPLSALPGGSFNQLRCAVRTRIVAAADKVSRPLFDLEVGQDADLEQGRLSESYVTAKAQLSPVTADALARFRAFGARAPVGTPVSPNPSFLDRFTEVRAGVTVADARGDNIHGGLIALGSGASARIKAGMEPLFDPRPIDFAPVNQATAGVTVKLSGLTASYDATFTVSRTAAGPAQLQQQALGLIWDSPCHCWKVSLSLVRDRAGLIQPRFAIDLSSGLPSGPFPR